jgi:hypothetical protein
MAIQRFFTESITISRLSPTEGNKIAYGEVGTVRGHIQALADEARQALGIIQEKAWKAWVPVDADVEENDTLTDEGGQVYKIREIVTKDYSFAANKHKELILMEQEPEE